MSGLKFCQQRIATPCPLPPSWPPFDGGGSLLRSAGTTGAHAASHQIFTVEASASTALSGCRILLPVIGQRPDMRNRGSQTRDLVPSACITSNTCHPSARMPGASGSPQRPHLAIVSPPAHHPHSQVPPGAPGGEPAPPA